MDIVFSFWAGYLLDSEYQMLFLSFWALIAIEFIRYGLSSLINIWYTIMSREGHGCIQTLRSEGQQIAAKGVSVLLSGHNNGKLLKKTVLSLRQQTIKKIQIIVVNDGSTDDTHEICQEMAKSKLVDNYINLRSRGGKSAALNGACVLAKYPYLLITDAGTTFHYDALELGLGYFDDDEVGAVSGNISVNNPYENFLTFMQKINYFYAITFAKMVYTMFGFPFVISGAFGIYRKDVFEHIGGYPPGTGEDCELAIMLYYLGWKVEFAMYATALTDVPETLGSFIKQRLRWDRDMVRIMHQKYTPMVHNIRHSHFNSKLAFGLLETNLMEVYYMILLYFYIVFFFFVYGDVMLYYMFAVYLFFIVFQVFFFSVSMFALPDEERDWDVLYFVPLYILFQQILLNPIRLWAFYSECFGRRSYHDDFVPKKVRDLKHLQARGEDIDAKD